MNKTTSKIIKTITISAICLPIVAFSAIKTMNIEKKAIFFPSKDILPVENQIKSKTEILSFKNSEGLNISYWNVKGRKNLPTIVYCHGNSDNASHFQKKIEFLADKGYEIFMIDYRGYGRSNGTPDENGLYTDLDNFLSHLKKEYNLPTENIVLWGHSLGGAVVTDVAQRHQFKAVILDSTFTNMDDMKYYGASFKEKNKITIHLKRFFYNFMPLTQKFESSKKVGNITSPLMILHSKKDEVIPVGMAYEMNKINPKSKLYISEYGLHDDMDWCQKPVENFLKKL